MAEGIVIAERKAEIISNFLAHALKPMFAGFLHSEAEDISDSSEHFEGTRCD